MQLTKFLVLGALFDIGITVYNLVDNYPPDAFFTKFNFFSSVDPSNAYVTYLDQSAAQAAGLISESTASARIGVDSTNIANGNGRKSVRIESKNSYLHALIIADISHMPDSICGTWPAFWTVGTTWPNDGEIDIIEGVNSQPLNLMSLHTTEGCRITNTGFTGQVMSSNCDVSAPDQPVNQGCGIQARSTNTYGTGFNAAGGGVYAMQWTSSAISVWFFDRDHIPANVQSANPDPSTWGEPLSQFKGPCNIDTLFHSQRIIFNTAFCGPWADALWSSDSVCSQKAATCAGYVKNNPFDFSNAYWTIKSLKVYQ